MTLTITHNSRSASIEVDVPFAILYSQLHPITAYTQRRELVGELLGIAPSAPHYKEELMKLLDIPAEPSDNAQD